MREIVFLVLNKFWNWLDFKKVAVFASEIIFFAVAIMKQDFAWLFSFNLALFWYLAVFYFWMLWVSKLLSFKRARWPILLFFGSLKLVVYTFPFFLVWTGEKYFPETIFETEATIFGIILSFWILIVDYWKQSKVEDYTDYKKATVSTKK